MVVFALTLSALLAVIGLLYTFGVVLNQRRALQTAADAASLKGSWLVLQQLASNQLGDAAVLPAIRSFATANGFPTDGALAATYVDAYGKQLCPPVTVGVASIPLAARGVQVSLSSDVPTILAPFLSGWQGKATVDNRTLTTAARATATARPVSLSSSPLVLPLAVSATDVKLAYNTGVSTPYDLFAWSLTRTLDLTTTQSGVTGSLMPNHALGWGDLATSERNWSDGQHMGTWAMAQPGTVDVAPTNPDLLTHVGDATYHWEIARGLADSIARQTAAGAAYGLAMVPVYDDTAGTSPVHIIGFAQFMVLSIQNTGTTPASVMGRYVPYTVATYGAVLPFATTVCGVPTAPVADFGAAQVSLVS
jgi:hypothetical protein